MANRSSPPPKLWTQLPELPVDLIWKLLGTLNDLSDWREKLLKVWLARQRNSRTPPERHLVDEVLRQQPCNLLALLLQRFVKSKSSKWISRKDETSFLKKLRSDVEKFPPEVYTRELETAIGAIAYYQMYFGPCYLPKAIATMQRIRFIEKITRTPCDAVDRKLHELCRLDHDPGNGITDDGPEITWLWDLAEMLNRTLNRTYVSSFDEESKLLDRDCTMSLIKLLCYHALKEAGSHSNRLVARLWMTLGDSFKKYIQSGGCSPDSSALKQSEDYINRAYFISGTDRFVGERYFRHERQHLDVNNEYQVQLLLSKLEKFVEVNPTSHLAQHQLGLLYRTLAEPKWTKSKPKKKKQPVQQFYYDSKTEPRITHIRTDFNMNFTYNQMKRVVNIPCTTNKKEQEYQTCALEHFNKACELQQSIRNKSVNVRYIVDRARTQFCLGKTNDAEQSFQEAYHIVCNMGPHVTDNDRIYLYEQWALFKLEGICEGLGVERSSKNPELRIKQLCRESVRYETLDSLQDIKDGYLRRAFMLSIKEISHSNAYFLLREILNSELQMHESSDVDNDRELVELELFAKKFDAALKYLKSNPNLGLNHANNDDNLLWHYIHVYHGLGRKKLACDPLRQFIEILSNECCGFSDWAKLIEISIDCSQFDDNNGHFDQTRASSNYLCQKIFSLIMNADSNDVSLSEDSMEETEEDWTEDEEDEEEDEEEEYEIVLLSTSSDVTGFCELYSILTNHCGLSVFRACWGDTCDPIDGVSGRTNLENIMSALKSAKLAVIYPEGMGLDNKGASNSQTGATHIVHSILSPHSVMKQRTKCAVLVEDRQKVPTELNCESCFVFKQEVNWQENYKGLLKALVRENES